VKVVFNTYSAFMNEARKDGKIVTVTYHDGATRVGVIGSFDDVTLSLLDPTQSAPTLVFLSGVRQIQ
jgi:sRNA-binding regulator protein Hfq